MNTSHHRFAVACPQCGVGLKVTETDLGQTKTCPRCSAPFLLPTREQAQQAAEQRKSRRAEFSFCCRLCGSRIYVQPEQLGTRLKCPDCHTVNVVRRPPGKPTPTPAPKLAGPSASLAPAALTPAGVGDSVDDPDELRFLDDEPVAVKPVRWEDMFAFPCRVCESRLYAARTSVGQGMICPDCGAKLKVPPPPPPKKTTVVTLEDPGIVIEAASTRPEQEVVNVDRLMSAAEQRVKESERKTPKTVKRPFWDGVYTFPLQPLSLAYVAFGSLAGGVILYLIDSTVESEGPESVIGLLMMVLAVFLGAPALAVVSHFLLSTVHWTAMGYSRVEDVGSFDILQYLRNLLFLINAFGVSSLPGLLVGWLIPDPTLAAVALALSLFAIFPLVMLSMLDAESLVGFVSPFVWSSLIRHSGPWIKFYASNLVPWCILAAIQIAAWLYPHPGWLYATLVWGLFALVLYFRLLGRLAYVLDQPSPDPRSHELASNASRSIEDEADGS